MTDDTRSTPPPHTGGVRPPYVFLDPAPRPAEVDSEVAVATDRLVRHLFDVGLQLHTLQAVFDNPGTTRAEIRAAGAAVGAIIDDLDLLIRDAGLAMLSFTTERIPTHSSQRRRQGARRPRG
ncbi:hypothetical protein [Nocardia mexicana]|uniref:Uncharacterized protein n=1 Tax=Nocardia mexicana TaxID=279262 RepID=A0A370HE60_9NOCA|nr:hypothetical protein [Nocardia mexicana]RDI55534.1 hypothetical protein DFR68_101367 [Nocardia mexicana]